MIWVTLGGVMKLRENSRIIFGLNLGGGGNTYIIHVGVYIPMSNL